MDPNILAELASKGPAVVYLAGLVALFMLYRKEQGAHAEELRVLNGKYEALLREAVASLTKVAEELKND